MIPPQFMEDFVYLCIKYELDNMFLLFNESFPKKMQPVLDDF